MAPADCAVPTPAICLYTWAKAFSRRTPLRILDAVAAGGFGPGASASEHRMKAATAGVILAGGQSRRMGGLDKPLVELGGKILLTRVAGRFASQVDAMVINANRNQRRYREFGFPLAPDSVRGFAGPLAGVLAGMDWAHQNGCERIVTVAGDTPFFPDDLVIRLDEAATRESKPIAMAANPDHERGRARHPTFGLWPANLRGDLREALASGVRKVVHWADQHGVATALFEDEEAFFNINTPEDLERAEAILKGRARESS